MTDSIFIVGGFVAGALLGIYFAIGLWWTTTRLAQSEHPVLLLAASFIARLLPLVALLYLLFKVNPWAPVTTLAGFIFARIFTVHRIGKPVSPNSETR